ncbi:MAG: amino acid transporter, partial [Leptolyngbya sp. ERB_1_1]
LKAHRVALVEPVAYPKDSVMVTIIFEASVEAQGGAYATGVLVLMSSAAFAVTLSTRNRQSPAKTIAFGVITLVFIYTTIVNIIERPEGIRIASLFIGAIIFTSLISRVWRSTELRVEQIEFDEVARQFIVQENHHAVRLIANRRNTGDEREYFLKEQEVREDTHIPPDETILFLEIQISDASQFSETIQVRGAQVGPYRILRARSAAVPNAIAAISLAIRDETGRLPHVYFGWIEGNPFQYLMRFILFGEGDIAIITREVLRKAERDPARRPRIHVGG